MATKTTSQCNVIKTSGIAYTASFSSSERTAWARTLTPEAASSDRERTAARRAELCWVNLMRVAWMFLLEGNQLAHEKEIYASSHKGVLILVWGAKNVVFENE